MKLLRGIRWCVELVYQWYLFLNGLRQRSLNVNSRSLSIADRRTCYEWIDANCLRSLSNPVWGNMNHTFNGYDRDGVLGNPDKLDPWYHLEAQRQIITYLYDRRERMMFKLVWG